ncbi:MAG: hypothetical protein AB1472_03210 [Candidatus Omnitrophota bacterium]
MKKRMKIKFPEFLVIGDTKFRIIQDNKRDCGECCYSFVTNNGVYKSGTIIIGTQYLEKEPRVVLISIIHELKEIIQCECEQGTRHTQNDDGWMFHYGHICVQD